MQSRLIVKNFGPITFVDLDLRNVNVFIGPQASGKSALAKLFTIFKAPRKFLMEETNDIHGSILGLINVLEEYNIVSFLKPNTHIEFISELHDCSFINGKVSYEAKLRNKIQKIDALKNNYIKNINTIKDILYEICKNFVLFYLEMYNILNINAETTTNFLEELTEDKLNKLLITLKRIDLYLSTNTAIYIPAERNLANIIKASAVNLMLHKVPIPKHLLLFAAELEKSKINEIDLGFLHDDLIYKKIDGEDEIFFEGKNSIKLIESASGIQSVIPILLTILSKRDWSSHKSYVIEEPELNLFPIAQYELIKRIELERYESLSEDDGEIHTYTTHSPYILSSINNLLYAYKVKNKNQEINVQNKLLNSAINPKYFTAYQISNGGAESIFDREKGLIIDNYIDRASDEMTDDFDSLMNLMK